MHPRIKEENLSYSHLVTGDETVISFVKESVAIAMPRIKNSKVSDFESVNSSDLNFTFTKDKKFVYASCSLNDAMRAKKFVYDNQLPSYQICSGFHYQQPQILSDRVVIRFAIKDYSSHLKQQFPVIDDIPDENAPLHTCYSDLRDKISKRTINDKTVIFYLRYHSKEQAIRFSCQYGFNNNNTTKCAPFYKNDGIVNQGNAPIEEQDGEYLFRIPGKHYDVLRSQHEELALPLPDTIPEAEKSCEYPTELYRDGNFVISIPRDQAAAKNFCMSIIYLQM